MEEEKQKLKTEDLGDSNNTKNGDFAKGDTEVEGKTQNINKISPNNEELTKNGH